MEFSWCSEGITIAIHYIPHHALFAACHTLAGSSFPAGMLQLFCHLTGNEACSVCDYHESRTWNPSYSEGDTIIKRNCQNSMHEAWYWLKRVLCSG